MITQAEKTVNNNNCKSGGGNRNLGIDILRIICAFFVVCIHKPLTGSGAWIFMSVVNIAVPCFFMITGYYYTNIEKNHRQAAQLKKTVLITVAATAIYVIYDIIKAGNLAAYITKYISVSSMKLLLLINIPITQSGHHLWYLYAMIYVLVIVYVIRKINKTKLLYALTPILCIMCIFLQTYINAFTDKTVYIIYSRNFLFTGLPCFAIGMLIHEKRDIIASRLSDKLNVTLIAVLAVLNAIEYYCLLNKNIDTNMYFMTIPLSVAVFIYFTLKLKTENKTAAVLSNMGRRYSMYVYIIHLLVMDVLNNLIGQNSVYVRIAPVFVFLTALIISAAVAYTEQQCKRVRRKNELRIDK